MKHFPVSTSRFAHARAQLAYGVLASCVVFACAASVPTANAQKTPPTPPLVLGERSPRTLEGQVTLPHEPGKKRVFIRGGLLMFGNGTHLENGSLLISNGRIEAIGRADDLPPPADADVVDAYGKVVTPGLIDTHSHMGVYAVPDVVATSDGNEMTDPATPYVFSEHAFWPQDPALERAVQGGITTIQVLPGSGNVIGGRAVTLSLLPRLEARAMRFPGAPFGLKMACGENPKRVYGLEKKTQPMSRMGSISRMRQEFTKAREYAWDRRAFRRDYDAWRKRYDAYVANPSSGDKPGDEPREPPRDLGLETLADVLDGKIRVHIHCYRADEMLLMIALSRELGFRIASFHHAVEAYKIADVLAKESIHASVWADWWGFKLEAYDGIEENAAILEHHRARPVIHSDSPTFVQRLNQEAAKAMFAGRRAGIAIDEDHALEWITLNPAKALGIDAETGSLEKGKMANVVVWNRSPFSIYASAEKVFIEGTLAFDASAVRTLPWSDFEVTGVTAEVQP